MNTTHISVLQEEAISALAIKPSSVIVDATLGAGGHARSIAALLGNGGTLVAIDADPKAVEQGSALCEHEQVTIHTTVGNFKDIDSILEQLHIKTVDGILADLGWRMEQFSGNGKGFSFRYDEELVMTYGDPHSYPFVARDIVNGWGVEDIRNVLKAYGEERYAARIARAIVAERVHAPIHTSGQLAELIARSVPSVYRHGRIHPATKTFQALRITVNDELEVLEVFIRKSVALLKSGGRLAIITFQSLEDRIVKHLFRQLVHDQVGVLVAKKPTVPTREEQVKNPRARSAKLRIFEKT